MEGREMTMHLILEISGKVKKVWPLSIPKSKAFTIREEKLKAREDYIKIMVLMAKIECEEIIYKQPYQFYISVKASVQPVDVYEPKVVKVKQVPLKQAPVIKFDRPAAKYSNRKFV